LKSELGTWAHEYSFHAEGRDDGTLRVLKAAGHVVEAPLPQTTISRTRQGGAKTFWRLLEGVQERVVQVNEDDVHVLPQSCVEGT
jgi:hypothetical protein